MCAGLCIIPLHEHPSACLVVRAWLCLAKSNSPQAVKNLMQHLLSQSPCQSANAQQLHEVGRHAVIWLTPFSLYLSGPQNPLVGARSVSSQLDWKGTGIKCEGKCRSWLPSEQRRLSLPSWEPQAGRSYKAQPEFPSGRILWAWLCGKETGCCAWAGNLLLSPFHWPGVVLGANHAIRQLTVEIWTKSSLPSTKVWLSLCLVAYFVPSLHFQPAPGYSLASCSGGNMTLGWDADKKATKIQWLRTSIYR